MADAKAGALIERPSAQQLQEMAGTEINNPQMLAERIRYLQGQAHILSPMAAVGALAPGFVITPIVVVIDPTVDKDTGRGADVYFQAAIHTKREVGRAEPKDGQRYGRKLYEPLEVSLNKQGLLKILTASGVKVLPSRRLDDGKTPYLWIMASDGVIREFDGSLRSLPRGTYEVDLRDGSPQIGEWTPEEWKERVRVAEEQKKRTPENERWKVEPEAINGWTHARVINARKFGYRLAEAKSLNALARNLGIKQVYSVAELQKPFVIFRPTFRPDMSDPEIKRMVTMANLSNVDLMYGGLALPDGGGQPPVTHGFGEPALEGDLVHEGGEAEEGEAHTATDAPPDDAEEMPLDEPKADEESKARPADPLYLITKIQRRGEGAETQYFVSTNIHPSGEAGPVFFTADAGLLKPLQAAAKDAQPRAIAAERVGVSGKSYLQILELTAAGGLKL